MRSTFSVGQQVDQLASRPATGWRPCGPGAATFSRTSSMSWPRDRRLEMVEIGIEVVVRDDEHALVGIRLVVRLQLGVGLEPQGRLAAPLSRRRPGPSTDRPGCRRTCSRPGWWIVARQRRLKTVSVCASSSLNGLPVIPWCCKNCSIFILSHCLSQKTERLFDRLVLTNSPGEGNPSRLTARSSAPYDATLPHVPTREA